MLGYISRLMNRPTVAIPRLARPALLIGHSNVFAVRLALAKSPAIGDWLDICPILAEKLRPEVELRDGADHLHPGLAKRLDDAEYGTLFLSIGGGPHITLGIVQNAEPFDFILPGEEEGPLDETARIIPFGAIMAILRERNDIYIRTFAAIRQRFCGPIFQIAYPPPVPEAQIRAFPTPFGTQIADHGISSLHLRRKLWKANLMVIREVCKKHGITMIDCPPHMVGADDTLAPQGFFTDPIHGGLGYGEAVVAQIEARLEGTAG